MTTSERPTTTAERLDDASPDGRASTRPPLADAGDAPEATPTRRRASTTSVAEAARRRHRRADLERARRRARRVPRRAAAGCRPSSRTSASARCKQQAEARRAAPPAARRASCCPCSTRATRALSHGADRRRADLRARCSTRSRRRASSASTPTASRSIPTSHEAVHARAGGDGDEPAVVRGAAPGYLWKGRVLRPAMVKVRG